MARNKARFGGTGPGKDQGVEWPEMARLVLARPGARRGVAGTGGTRHGMCEAGITVCNGEARASPGKPGKGWDRGAARQGQARQDRAVTGMARIKARCGRV